MCPFTVCRADEYDVWLTDTYLIWAQWNRPEAISLALFQIAGVTSANEIFGAIFIFTILAFLYNMALVMKILPTHDGNDHHIKNAIRPLIPMVVILIRYFTL